MVVFQEQNATWSQSTRRIHQHRANGLQAILSTNQRKMGFMLPHHWIQPTHQWTRDVWRITHHDLKLSPKSAQGSPPRSMVQPTRLLWGKGLEVRLSQRQSIDAQVHSMPLSIRPSTAQADGDRTTARA
jgi:hypothetical protein